MSTNSGTKENRADASQELFGLTAKRSAKEHDIQAMCNGVWITVTETMDIEKVRAIAAEARANDAENRAAEADAIAEKALEVSFFSFSYGQLV